MPQVESLGETALVAGYQVTARWFASEQQLIWRRTALFVALNTLVAGALQFVKQLPATIHVLVPIVGLAYSVCWFFSMKREWAYHDFLNQLMREQERALGLGPLGPATRAHGIVSGGPGEEVGGEKVRFGVALILFRARVLAHAIIWLFAAVYGVLGFVAIRAA